ncbi:MAG: Gfo/Idh/MocA family oxidoreductase [Chloroflexi bacterium]|nr:Gfo/Idh/MocA family oxidoreductase [Chloroflexota bacterium]
MASTLRVGIVGIGQRGVQHLKALTELQQDEIVRLVALADPFPDNMEESKLKRYAPAYVPNSVERYLSVREMIDNAELDAVWFVMPPNQHRGEIEYAAQHGLHIYAEKPQSLFLDDVLSQDEAIRKAGVTSMVGFQMRHDRGYTDIRDYLKGKWVAAMTMISEGAVEGHGVKHTHTEERGGPANRVWTADRRWSGTSIVEAGIHQTDIMRYWSDDDVEWVRASYTERPRELWATEGDNPIAYTVTYGFKKGAIGNILFTKPARSYYSGRFDCIIWTHGTIKLEDDYVDYHYDGDWPPPERLRGNQVRKVISKGPHTVAMGNENTKAISQSFAEAITLDRPELLKNTFSSSINSLAAVLAANASNELGGDKVVIDEFIHSDKYARFRRRPASG